MNYFVFRNNTVERFFPKDYSFSGYDDVSIIPSEVEGYVWFYQAPVEPEQRLFAEDVKAILDKFEYVLSQISTAKTVIALTMVPAYNVPISEDDNCYYTTIESYNSTLFDLGRNHPNLKIINFSDFACDYPADLLIDWKYYYISQMGLNPKLTADFQLWWSKKLESISFHRKKCLVLDLDNTLWGGVLGEDGPGGIRIGGPYPGNAFLLFQKLLLKLSLTGIILAVCSKNNENDVLEVWEKNPFLILRKDHFAAWRINWSDKASNIKEIAEELNLGLDSFVFVDDNPAEREYIKQMLPMVAVPDFPKQPYDIPSFFKGLISTYFRVYSITNEDRKKTEQYKANAARNQARKSFSDYASFLTSLGIQLSIEPANEFSIPRIAQLTQKTNQFNLTTKRYTDSDIRGFLHNGWTIWSLSVSDKFGDNGISGALFVNGVEIDSFLLSCRILGKGIEKAFLKYVLSFLKEHGQKIVRASYVPTQKNMLVKDFYDQFGLKCVESNDSLKSYSAVIEELNLQIEDYYIIKN